MTQPNIIKTVKHKMLMFNLDKYVKSLQYFTNINVLFYLKIHISKDNTISYLFKRHTVITDV